MTKNFYFYFYVQIDAYQHKQKLFFVTSPCFIGSQSSLCKAIAHHQLAHILEALSCSIEIIY